MSTRLLSSSSDSNDPESGLYNFLDALPKQTIGRLYNTPASCLAIFRLLPLIARHLVLNMIWSEFPFSRSQVEIWSSKKPNESKKQLDISLNKLFRLHILEEVIQNNDNNSIISGSGVGEDDEKKRFKVVQGNLLYLNVTFKDNLRSSLTSTESNGSFGTIVSDSFKEVSELDRYATEKWETILHYMVGSRLPTRPSRNVLKLLEQTGLMVILDPRFSDSMKITSKGFQFLLEDVNTQRWDILLQYLRATEVAGIDVVEVMSCLFLLGSLELGQEYSFASWTPTQVQVLQDLVDYGLVLISGSDRFYPTRLATTLTSSAPPLLSGEHSSQDQGFVILETNYRIYAYTSNPLQIAVLNLFISLRYRFPNLVVGAITRDSTKSALSNGITADQIITFLKTHAHPQMRKLQPLLPPTVVDQIRLWELEKNRVRNQEGYLYEDFRSGADFELVLEYCKKLGIILWESVERRKVFVDLEGHYVLREFIRRRMNN